MEKNIKFISNIAPVLTKDIKNDENFLSKVFDIQALEEFEKKNIKFSPLQQKIYNSCSGSCSFLDEKAYVWGQSTEHNGELICKCTQYDCVLFQDCRKHEITDTELDEMQSAVDHSKALQAAIESYNKVSAHFNKENNKEELFGIKITSSGIIVIPYDGKRTPSPRDNQPYTKTANIIKDSQSAPSTKFFSLSKSEYSKKIPYTEQWSIHPDDQQPNLYQESNLCTEKAYRQVEYNLNESISHYNKEENKAEVLQWARNNGKHTASGYDDILKDFILERILKGIKLESINKKKELLQSLQVFHASKNSYIIGFGSYVTVQDLTNLRFYSFILLGTIDKEYIKNHKIIPYDSEIGKAFWNKGLKDKIRIKFSKEDEDYHSCKIVSVEHSKYIY